MSYQIAVEGALHLSPKANEACRGRVEGANRGWRVAPNGQLLYLPNEEHPDAFVGLRFVASLLRECGISVDGDVQWRGEDGSEGRIRVVEGDVEVIEAGPELLGSGEVDRLLGQLATGSQAERVQAIEILESFQQDSASAVQGLGAALRDPAMVRMRAANSLASLGLSSLPALDALVEALGDSEPWVQAAAAEALGAIGPSAASALPALRRLQDHPSYGPSGRAMEAIARITRR